MKRTLAVLAGASMVALGSPTAAAAPAFADPVGNDRDHHYIDDDDYDHYDTDIEADLGPNDGVPAWCLPGNTFIVINGFCLRLS